MNLPFEILAICIVAAILNIMLFFKVWFMTDDVREMRKIMEEEHKKMK